MSSLGRRYRSSILLLALVVSCTDSKPPAGKTIELEKLAFELPAAWKQEAPSSKMRVAQAKIAGDGGEAELAVFYFGEGQGGSAEENIRRWISQIEFVPGSSSGREQFDAQGFLITFVNFEGTLKASPMSGGPAVAKPNSRILGAVVEGPGGPWFFKATGPSATLAPQRDAFIEMLSSIRGK